MRWKYETYCEYYKRVGKWHKWFAWYPVSHDGTTFWLETVERRASLIFREYISWQYRKVNGDSNEIR